MMDVPRARIRPMAAKSCSISVEVRAEVGSSMTRMRPSSERALATSTIC